jgi:hypothetical protein
MVDIAIDLNGRMFGGESQPEVGHRIYQIDPETALCTFRFSFDDVPIGLTFLDDGRLVVAGERVTIVEPNHGSVLLDMVGAEPYKTSGDLVGLPDGRLYWTIRGEISSDPDRLVRIDPSSGAVTVLGSTSVDHIFGLGYANEILFGFTSDGEVAELDPRSGAVLNIRALEGAWWGATTNPVLWE